MSARASLDPEHVLSKLPEGFHAQSVKTIKGLAMDAVQKANSGHPGMPMGAADMATVLWSAFLVHDPSAPDWADRDRFVLSAGHGSMLLYALLHLSGYDLPLDELENFRQWGSKTAGHPELGHTPGVEVTTGPLGTGFAAGVGMALAERHLAATFNREGHSIVDHFTYGIVSDGDLMEGVSSEAASFAGHQRLGKLVYLYDDNAISIDGSTDLAFTENVGARFEAYGWQVFRVDGHDPQAILAALNKARADLERPSLICCQTVIGHGAPNMQGTAATHGAPLGEEEIAAAKKAMDWPEGPFHVPPAVKEGYAKIADQRAGLRRHWAARFSAYEQAHPKLAARFKRQVAGELPSGFKAAFPNFETGKSLATRKAGAAILAGLADAMPELVGGSADLAGSNGVKLPEAGAMQGDAPEGRNLHFGVREHGMAGIANGVALHGGLRIFDATFLVFSDFMRGCVRLSALMGLPVIHVWSHDSFYLGEDGPTHQPIEHLMSLRAMPNLHVVRPADANETVGAWRHALERRDGPTAIVVTRQGLPVLENGLRDVSRGAYTLWEPDGVSGPEDLDGMLLATGSEVQTALDAAKALEAAGTKVRVVSMPCWEAFEAQEQAYRDEVLPPSVTRRLSIEAGCSLGWDRYASAQVSIDHFGASAPAEVLAEKFGFTPDAVKARFDALK